MLLEKIFGEDLSIILAEPVVFLPPAIFSHATSNVSQDTSNTIVTPSNGSENTSETAPTTTPTAISNDNSTNDGDQLPVFAEDTHPQSFHLETHDDIHAQGPPPLLRGILKLTIVRPTKIKKISVRLLGVNDWDKDDPFEPPNEIPIIDRSYDLFNAATRADQFAVLPQPPPTPIDNPLQGSHPRMQRSSSIGPGISHNRQSVGLGLTRPQSPPTPTIIEAPIIRSRSPRNNTLRRRSSLPTLQQSPVTHSNVISQLSHSPILHRPPLVPEFSRRPSLMDLPEGSTHNPTSLSSLRNLITRPSPSNHHISSNHSHLPVNSNSSISVASSATEDSTRSRSTNRVALSELNVGRKEDGEKKHRMLFLANKIIHRPPVKSRGRSRSRVSSHGAKSESEEETPKSARHHVLKNAYYSASNEDAADFLPGVYSYPIQIQLPPNLPASIRTTHANVKYWLKAIVKRPGVLHHNLMAEQPLELVRALGEDNLEESMGMGVRKFWETQICLELSVAAKVAYIGGTLPFIIRITPMAKVKVYRVSANLEEKIDYFDPQDSDTDRVPVKTDIIVFKLFDTSPGIVKSDVLFPIESDVEDYKMHNPNLEFLSKDRSGQEDTRRITEWFDAVGPWTVAGELALPDCSTGALQPTFRHSLANLSISYAVKFTIRLERGDDEYLDINGKKRLFDLIIGAPIRLLSCHCNSATRLPSYFTALTDRHQQHRPHHHQYEHNHNHPKKKGHTNREDISSADVETEFSKLISGAVNEEGKEPPSYDQLQ